MGLFFTLFYIFTAYMGPQVLFGDLVQYHIEIIIAALAMLFSVLSLQDSDLLNIPQTYGVIGLIAAVPLSVVFSGWLGGSPAVFFDFLPNAMVFFFIVLNCRKKIHLQILVSVLLFTAVFNVSRGFLAEVTGNSTSVYLITMINSAGEGFYRIRGVDFLNDPNDLAQFMLMLGPCLFLFWGKGKALRNTLFVVLPMGFLLWGMYLTHSRGGMIALVAAVAVAGRRKFGVWRSLIVGAIIYIAISAAGFSGGRSTSIDQGEDRMDSWAAGLMMIRTHPLFGVGYRRFLDYHELTAHNSVVLCAAETGLTGLFFWMLVTVPTVRDAYVGSAPMKSVAADGNDKRRRKIGRHRSDVDSASEGQAAVAYSRKPQFKENAAPLRGAAAKEVSTTDEAAPALPAADPPKMAQRRFMGPRQSTDELTAAEIHRISNLMLIALAGFLTAGWFLPRAYTMTLFVLAGMTAVVYRMARQRKIALPPLPFPRAAKFAMLSGVVFIGLVWISLRASHL